jgi:isoquinoline 1-oxidoreductase beta subunit
MTEHVRHRGTRAPAATPADISRREFLQVSLLATGAFLVQVCLPATAAAQGRRGGRSTFAPNAFVRIDPDGQVTIIVARPEIGQGVRTSLAMLVAEELDVDWATVRIEQAAGVDHSAFGDQYAGGSQSVSHGWQPLRQAGAVARAMLVLAAARSWHVAPESCHTSGGVIRHVPSGRHLSYAQLATAAAQLPIPANVPLKDPSLYVLVGRPTRQVHGAELVNGSQRFGMDIRRVGMLFASIERAPVLGARIEHIDDRDARAIAGVRDVLRIEAGALPGFGDNSPRPPNGVAVIADSTWTALRARRALQIRWSGGAVDEDSERRLAQCRRLTQLAPELILRNDGDVEKAFATAARTLQATYELPLLAHAAMEPMNCTAHVRADRCELWVPTQNPAEARAVAAAICALPLESVTVNVTRSGGGFGRRFYADFVGEAVVLARASGVPVQVTWTREDDIQHDYYRPASYHAMRAALDERGGLLAWSQHLVNAQRGDFLQWAPPQGATVLPAGDEIGRFDFPAGLVPNLRLMATAVRACPVPLGQWRSVDDSANVFVYQSFIDELAHAAERDPLAYRLELLGSARQLPYYGSQYDVARLRAAFEMAAREAGWGTPLASGCGRGIAGSYANHGYVAVVAEVEVDSKREVHVRRMVAAVDVGRVVNPLGASAQIEGALLFGLSALRQEISVTNGKVQQRNFDDFPLVRMPEAPRIQVHFAASSGVPLGCGETGVPPVAPAITNAIYAATGLRLRRLPIRPTDLMPK